LGESEGGVGSLRQRSNWVSEREELDH